MICNKDAEEIGRVVCTPGSRMMAYPAGEPYAICDKSEYELKGDTIVIKERVDRFKPTHPLAGTNIALG